MIKESGGPLTPVGKHSPDTDLSAPRRSDHLWVAIIIAGAAAIEVCA
jgi:hypothetical protein